MTPNQVSEAVKHLHSAIACLIALDRRAALDNAAMNHADITQAVTPAAEHLANALRYLMQGGAAK